MGLRKTGRRENAHAGTLANAGMVVPGQLVVQGARVGQMVNPMTGKAIFLFDALPGNTLQFIAIGEPVLSWQEVTLELCPGSQPQGFPATAGERPSAAPGGPCPGFRAVFFAVWSGYSRKPTLGRVR